MSLCRPRGGRAAPRTVRLRMEAEEQMLNRLGCRKERASHRMTPEMRIEYLRRRLEELEQEQESMTQREGRVAVPLMLLRQQITELQDEIIGIYQGIAEAQSEEPTYQVLSRFAG